MCGLGVVSVSSIFGLVRRTGVFDEVFPTFVHKSLLFRSHFIDLITQKNV